MRIKYFRLTSIFFFILGLAASNTALGQDMVISAASPESGEQGTPGLDVIIVGSGFDDTVDEVMFILHCGKRSCPDTGDIVVNEFQVLNSGEIATNIDILDTAQVAGFDIVLRSTRGRGGKGTTFKGENKFSVKIKPNQSLVNCDKFAPHGSCTCMFSYDSNDNIYGMLGDCVTSETLYLTRSIWTAGTVQTGPDGPERLTLTAVNCDPIKQNCDGVGTGAFSGSSVVANVYHRAGIRFIGLVIGEGVEAGCSGGLWSAISFVLDEFTPDPKTTWPEELPDPINRNSLFSVADTVIRSEDQALCYGIEVVRAAGYSRLYTVPDPGDDNYHDVVTNPARDWKVYVANNAILAGSYLRAGIYFEGMMPTETINPPSVLSNSVGAAACGGGLNPVGVYFGNLSAIDPEELIEGVVEGNDINMAGDCGNEPIGMQVVGDNYEIHGAGTSGTQTTAKVNKNAISGAYVGVEVDCNVVDVNLSGNTLTGGGDGVNGDTGVDSYAQSTREKGKPNEIMGYDFNVIRDHDRCDLIP